MSVTHSKEHSSTLIELNHVAVTFENRRSAALTDISFRIDCGEIVTLVGPNGAGKSTLVKVALGLIKPTSGKVYRRADLRVAYVPQKLQIDASIPMTVQRFMQLHERIQTAKIQTALDQVDAGNLINQSVTTLSGGELQRVLLAQSILRKPDLLILDEPAAGVDVNGQTQLYALIESIRQHTGCAVLLISHDLHIVMASTDKVLCLNKHLCCSGSPEAVQQHPEFIQLFGEHAAKHIAVYKHLHHHHHHLDGEVIEH